MNLFMSTQCLYCFLLLFTFKNYSNFIFDKIQSSTQSKNELNQMLTSSGTTTKRQSLGCWRDRSQRAISGGIRFRGSIDKCEQFARRHNYKVFAIQYGGECFTASNAHQTYRKYGHAKNCRNGTGGGWAQNVYTTGGISKKPKRKVTKKVGKSNSLKSTEGIIRPMTYNYLLNLFLAKAVNESIRKPDRKAKLKKSII